VPSNFFGHKRNRAFDFCSPSRDIFGPLGRYDHPWEEKKHKKINTHMKSAKGRSQKMKMTSSESMKINLGLRELKRVKIDLIAKMIWVWDFDMVKVINAYHTLIKKAKVR
jgi:hypothetical protein